MKPEPTELEHGYPHWHRCRPCGFVFRHFMPDYPPDDPMLSEKEERHHTCPACGDVPDDWDECDEPASIGPGWRVKFDVYYQHGIVKGKLIYTAFGELVSRAERDYLLDFGRGIWPTKPQTPDGPPKDAGEMVTVRITKYVYPESPTIRGCADIVDVAASRLLDLGGAPLPARLIRLDNPPTVGGEDDDTPFFNEL